MNEELQVPLSIAQEAYRNGYQAGQADQRKRILELIEEHDPRGADANPHYWGKTLRAAIEALSDKG